MGVWRTYAAARQDDGQKFCRSSGYRLVENDGLASHGGFKDWFLSEFERPGFTFEIGRGENPLPLSSFERIYEKLEETLLLAALM